MKRNSILQRFVALVMMFVIPLLIVLNFSNFYYCRLSQKQAAQSGADLITLYMNQVDKSIEHISNSMCLFATSNFVVSVLNNNDENSRNYAATEIQYKLKSQISNFDIADSIFVYGAKHDCYIYTYEEGSTYSQRQLQKKYLDENCFDSSEQIYLRWNNVRIGEKNYILWLMGIDSVYVGAWIDIDMLQKPLLTIKNSYTASFIFSDIENRALAYNKFINENGIKLKNSTGQYYQTGNKQKYIVTEAKSSLGSFKLYMIFPQKNILESLDKLQLILFIISICALLIIPAILFLCKKNLLTPLEVLDNAVKEIEQGNLQYQIGKTDAPVEFLQINEAFDKMTVQLRCSKIKEYEDKLDKQKLKLAYLNMQIRPHFFLNALTTVSNFAKLNEPEQMNRYISYLANYLRYMFRSNLTLVNLKEEIGHIKTYLSMQEVRFNGTLSHLFDIEPAANNIKVPPFVAHNFVENVVKHAMADCNHVMLYLQAKLQDSYLCIIIEDDGSGLTKEAITQINDPEFKPQNGHNIGIWNIRQTLAILYGGKASIHISTSPLSGTRVEINIPKEGALEGGLSDESIDF